MKNISSSVVDQFTRAMTDLSKSNKQTGPVTVPGTVVSISGSEYQVRLDGSTVFTPAQSTVAYTSGDRVSVSLANHQATIVGNYTDQSVGSTAAYNAGYSGGGVAGAAAASVYLLGDGQVVIGNAAASAAGDYITTGAGASIISNSAATASQGYIQANLANIGSLVAGNLTSDTAFINSLTAGVINSQAIYASDIYADMVKASEIITDYLTADSATIGDIITEHLTAEEIEAKSIWVQAMTAAFGSFDHLNANFADIGFANIADATINNLFAKYASFEAVDTKLASIQKLMVDTGYIVEVTIGEGEVTKRLDAVEINADYIVAGTLKADRIKMKGEDGFYHYINSTALDPEEAEDDKGSDGVFINGIDGSKLIAQTVLAEKINVDDLHAFNATIGGLIIDEHSLHSFLKTSLASDANGFYVDDRGLFSIGSGSNYIRYGMRQITRIDELQPSSAIYTSGEDNLRGPEQAPPGLVKALLLSAIFRRYDTTSSLVSVYSSDASIPVKIKYDLSTEIPIGSTLVRVTLAVNCRCDSDQEGLYFNVKSEDNNFGTINSWDDDNPQSNHIASLDLENITIEDLESLYMECVITNNPGALNGLTLIVEYVESDPNDWSLDVNFSNFEEFENERVTQAHYIRFNELSTLADATNRVAVSIGSDLVEDKYILELDNETGIKYVHAGDVNPISFWDGDTFHSGNLEIEVTKKAQFGNFAFLPRSDGSLMLVKVN